MEGAIPGPVRARCNRHRLQQRCRPDRGTRGTRVHFDTRTHCCANAHRGVGTHHYASTNGADRGANADQVVATNSDSDARSHARSHCAADSSGHWHAYPGSRSHCDPDTRACGQRRDPCSKLGLAG